MKLRRIMISLAILVVGFGAALAIAGGRYTDAAAHAAAMMVLIAGAGGAASLLILALAMRGASQTVRVLLYSLAMLASSGIAVMREVGRNGILPRADGAQAVGWQVLAVDADLFVLVAVTVALAGRGVLAQMKKSPDDPIASRTGENV